MAIKHKGAIKSISLLWLGSLLGSGSTFLIYTIVARKIGPEIFGLFSSAIAIASILTLIAGFGVSKVWLKLFGEEGFSATRWVKPSLLFVFYTLLLVTALIILLVSLDFHGAITKKLILLLGFYVYGFVSVELVIAKFQLEEKYKLMAFWQLLPNLFRLIIVLSAYYLFNLNLSVIELGIIYAAVGVLFVVLGMVELYKFYKGNVQLNRDKVAKNPKIKDVFIEAWPFGFANLFAFIYVQSDIIMIKYISGDIETGYYNASFVIMTALLLIPSILFGKFLLPKYHRWAYHNTEKFLKVYRLGNKLMVISGIILFLVVYFGAGFFIPLIFGDEYLPSVSLMKLLSLTLPVSFLAYSIGATLVTKSHMKTKVLLMGIVAIINILLNVILIQIYDAKGAAIATILSNMLLLCLYYWIAKKKVFVKEQ